MDSTATLCRIPLRRGLAAAAGMRGSLRGGRMMLRWVGFAGAMVAWTFSLGLQWPALQIAAWFKMAADYQTRMSWVEAVEEAVTGPKCAMCVAIEDAQAGSREADSPASAAIQDVTLVIGLPPADDDGIIPCAGRWTWPVDAVRMTLRRDEPPAPPPRAVA
jgi:hypothetical protein